jgi:Ni/Co efflux regulator RcnB
MRYAIKSGLSLLFVMAAVAAGPAMARDQGRGHDRDNDRGHDRYGYQDRGDRDHDGRDRDRYDSRRRDDGRYYSHYRDDRRGDRYYRPAPPRVVYRPAYHPGYGPPRWARGGRYYDQGYGPTYVVRDYRGYGLRAPPRGYYWRRSDAGDYLLVAVATGIITDLILRH